MRILVSNFIASLIQWFFSIYPKFSYIFYQTGSAYRPGVTYTLVSSQIDAGNVLKIYFTSPCTITLDVDTSYSLCFNPSADCYPTPTCALSSGVSSYVKYAVVPANQTTLVVQIRLPQDIT